jgi:GT2 family glycosyltransferase
LSLLSTVIIVSRGRPQSLILTLDALRYQTMPEFEVIVVGGAEELAVIDEGGFANEVNFVGFHDRNIAVARNLGLASASGELVAFLDDDAVPAPGWLGNLSTALKSSGAELAAGYVRGPDGINFQFSGAFLLSDATHEPIETVCENRDFVASPGRAVEAMGTNVAYTRAALEAVGEFDPAFTYFLDESDLNWRLARDGARAVIAPWAQVVHTLAASDLRSEDRVPLTLFDIGRSTRTFLDKHFGGDIETVLKTHRAYHEQRLRRHLRAGRLKPDSLASVLGSFDDGIAANPALASDIKQQEAGRRTGSLMRRRKDATRVNRMPNWVGKETLTYSGKGVWTWHKPRFRRHVASGPLSSVPKILGSQ